MIVVADVEVLVVINVYFCLKCLKSEWELQKTARARQLGQNQ